MHEPYLYYLVDTLESFTSQKIEELDHSSESLDIASTEKHIKEEPLSELFEPETQIDEFQNEFDPSNIPESSINHEVPYFTTKRNLNNHIAYDHDGKKLQTTRVKCTICEKIFSSSSNIRTHISNKHKDVTLEGNA